MYSRFDAKANHLNIAEIKTFKCDNFGAKIDHRLDTQTTNNEEMLLFFIWPEA